MSSEFKKWEVIYTKQAADSLRNLPQNVRKRISKKMRFFVSSDNLLRFAKTLQDKKLGDFRFRVGGYRIIFSTIKNQKKAFILKIGKRDEVYK